MEWCRDSMGRGGISSVHEHPTWNHKHRWPFHTGVPSPSPHPPRRDPSHCREVLIHIQLYKHWKLCIVAVVRRSTEFSNYTDVSKWTLQSSIQTRYFSHRKTTGKERHNTLTVAEMGSLVPGIKKCKLTVPDWITLSLVPASVSIDTIIKSDN